MVFLIVPALFPNFNVLIDSCKSEIIGLIVQITTVLEFPIDGRGVMSFSELKKNLLKQVVRVE